MNQASSNSTMQRSTVETLKQIQKQGLSISIVTPDSARSSFSLDTPVTKETKPIVTIDKTTKLPIRSSVATESKATISQIKSVPNSSAEIRAAGGQSISQTSFQDAKIPGNITKSINPSVTGSETRAFGSQSWSKSGLSVTSENKVQGTSNLAAQPEIKTPGVAGRNSQNSAAFSETKIQNTRTVQNISQLADNKSQNRIGQMTTLPESKNQGNQSRNQSQLTFEGKLQAGQSRVSISSPPSDVKTINSNQDNSTNSPITPVMSTPRGTAKRPQAVKVTNSTPVAKKKCTKRVSPNTEAVVKRLQNVDGSFSSEDGSPQETQFFNMKGLTPGLTITPVGGNVVSSTNPSTSGNATKATVAGATVSAVVSCPSCQQLSVNLHFCDSCHSRIPSTAQQIPLNRRTDAAAFVVTKNVTTSIQKQIVFQFQDSNQTCLQFQQAVQGKVLVETNQSVSPRSKGRPRTKRKYVEPVCYTLSSDEEEPVQASFHPVLEGAQPNVSQFFAGGDSEGSKSEHSSGSEALQDGNQEFDDSQFPGVTDINEQFEMEEEPEEEEEEMEFEHVREEEELDESFEEEEEEEIPPEEPEPDEIRGQKPTDYPLRCRSIRIGSYKIHPYNNLLHIPVNLSVEAISFLAPVLYDSKKIINVCLRSTDITRVLVHFGRCLPIMFVFTTPAFAELIRNALRMNSAEECFFDPTSRNEKIQKITFLIDSMTDEQRNFLRHCFPGDKKVKEIDQKEANEILVKSTPNQNSSPLTKLQIAQEQPVTVQMTPTQLQACAQKIIPQQPVVKLLTYPPPPQTGGIAITSEDMNCLNEGEFLNDAIIDFYLKYIFNEKLTPTQREKTHIFSSFFYPRLTHKPDRTRPEDSTKNIQVRRHNQVKTWTRHVDIFSKDFIIIPVNQNVHWFLAIICYPGKVQEVPESASKPEVKSNKSSDNVSSTVEQAVELNNSKTKVVIRELSNSGEGECLNQDENSTSSINSAYLVEEPPDSDEPSPETPDSTTPPDGKRKKELPCICIFDSLCGPNRWRIPATLREYLEMEWKMKKGTKKIFDKNTMQGFMMKCPQQTNFSDCGTYLLGFVEKFFEDPMPYFSNPMPDMTDWFTETEISKKRQQIKDLINNISQKQGENANARKAKLPDGVQMTPITVQQTNNR